MINDLLLLCFSHDNGWHALGLCAPFFGAAAAMLQRCLTKVHFQPLVVEDLLYLDMRFNSKSYISKTLTLSNVIAA